MTVSFVGSASTEATSVTLPAHQAGDLILIFAGRTGAATVPTIPAGWRFASQTTQSGTTPPAIGCSVGWKIATSSAETSGTWTGATMLLAVVIRDDANLLVIGGIGKTNTSGTTTVNYPVLGLNSTQSVQAMRWTSSYILLPVIVTSNTSDIDTPPTASTSKIVSLAGTAAIEMAIHRTNAEVASWASTNYTANESVRYATWAIEILDTGYAKTAAASFRPVNIRGGADQ